MTLQPGARLGPYEVLAPLGAGGMGEVYRARDTRLGREVAVKVLPEAFSADREALSRFEREARAVAALSHPNILALFDVGESEGVRFAVTELLEGETLRAALERGSLPLRKALDVAASVAEGLAAAHEKGIVHRDVKPENVFLTNDSRVKLLDFGLARQRPRSAPDQTRSPTVTSLSEPGVVVGTVAYMSPEQARGDALDFRSDQFSLGTVLFEMLSGTKPFRGASVPETLTAIIRDEPDPLETRVPDLPAPVSWHVERLLRKEPAERYDSTRDLARDLRGLQSRLSSRAPAAAAVRPARSRRAQSALFALAGLALLVLGIVAGRRMTPPPMPPPRQKFITSSGRDGSPAISPDGRLCAFVSDRDGTPRIWLKQLAGGSEIALTEGPDAAPRFTPDSASLFFVRQGASGPALYRVSTLGGSPQRVLVGVTEADMSADGARIAFVRSHAADVGQTRELWVAAADGSGARLVDTTNLYQLRSPRWSPDGIWVATAGGEINIGSPWTIFLVNPATGKKRTLPPAPELGEISNLAWTGDGRALVYGRRDQAIVPASPGTYFLQDVSTGAVRTIAFSLGVGVGLDIAGRGRLVVESLTIPTNLLEASLAGRTTTRKWLTQGSHVNFQPLVSGNGGRLVFTSNRDGNSDVWEMTLSTNAVRRLTDHPASDADVFLSPDGNTLLWASTRTGHFEIWGAEGDGSAPHRISDDGADAENPSLSPDGSTIVYVSFHDAKRGIWTIRPDGSNARLLAPGPNILPEISPNGAWVSFSRQGSSQSIEVVDLKDGASIFSIPDVPAGRGFIRGRHRWMPGGRRIVFLGGDGPGTALFVQDVAPGTDTSATRRKLVSFDPDMELHSFGIAPDMSFAVVAVRQPTMNLLEIDGLPREVAPPARRP